MLAAIEELEVHTITEKGTDWSITYRVIPIIENVKVHVYEDDMQAVLIFNDSAEIEFSWTEEVAAMFENIDTCEPIELLEIIARLNQKLEDEMQDVREANGFGYL